MAPDEVQAMIDRARSADPGVKPASGVWELSADEKRAVANALFSDDDPPAPPHPDPPFRGRSVELGARSGPPHLPE